MATRTISNAGGNWTATTAWVEGVIPTNADDVVATATSGPLVVLLGAVCRSLDLTGYTKTFSGAQNLVVGGSTSAPGDMVKIPASGFTHSFTGGYILTTTAPTPQTLNILRAIGAAVTINGSGTVQLAANLTLSGQDITHTAGTFDINGRTVSLAQLFCTGAIARTLTFGAATVTLTISGQVGLNVTGSNYTISASAATINMGQSAGFQGGGGTYGTVAWANLAASPMVGIVDSNTFTNLTFNATGTPELHFLGGTTQTVTGTLTMTSASGRIHAGTGLNNFPGAFNAGTPATIALGATGTAVLTNVSFLDINVTGTNTPVGGTRLGDALGNSGITFAASRTLYWVGNSGNWTDATNVHWATSSGGTPGAGIPHPLPQDDVVIDNNSFSSPNQTITCDTLFLCRDLTAATTQAGCKTATALGSNSTFGSIALAGTGQFILNTTMFCRARSAVMYTPHSSGAGFTLLTIQAPGGTVSLAGDLLLTGTLRLAAGKFDGGGHDVTVQTFSAVVISGTSNIARELRMGGGLWTLLTATGWTGATSATLFTLTRGTSSLLVSGTPPSADVPITSGQQQMPPMVIDIPVKAVRIVDSSDYGAVTLISGGLTLPTVAATMVALISTGSTTRTITLTSGTLTVTSLTLAGPNLTFVAATSTVTVTPTALETNVNTNGVTFNVLRLNSPAGGEITVYDPVNASGLFTAGPAGGIGTVSFNESVTVTNFSAIGNSATNRIKVYGPPWGGQTTITANTTTVTNVDLINIIQAGAAAWTGTSKTNTSTGYSSQAIEV